MTQRHSITAKLATALALVTVFGLAGCKKKADADKAVAGAGEKTAEGAGNLPALTADPEPAAITPADQPPLDSVKFRNGGKRNKNGWPKYTAYNYGTKVVTAMAVYGYAYDASGKQVARTQTPMSWNGKLAAGGKSDWEIEIGMSGTPVPDTAASYEPCYDSIKFEGDDKWTNDTARCPEQKPKSK